MIDILATVCFKPIYTSYNEKFTCVGLVHSNTDNYKSTHEMMPHVINKMVKYLGFQSMEDYYKHYHGLTKDLIEKQSDYYYDRNPSIYDIRCYHPLASTFYTNQVPDHTDRNQNCGHIEYFKKFLNPLTDSVANECLYMVPTFDEMCQYDIVRNSLSKDDLWFIERVVC